MPDGWSDKSITPVIYTPDAANTPALEIDRVTGQNMDYDAAGAVVTTKITPIVPVAFKTIGTWNAATQLGTNAFAERSDGQWIITVANKAYLWNPLTPTVVPVLLGNINATATNLIKQLKRIRNNTILGIVSNASVSTPIHRSTDDGATWGAVTQASPGLANYNISRPSSSGIVVVAQLYANGANNQPCVQVLPNFGESGNATRVVLTPPSGSETAVYGSCLAAYVGGTTFLAIAYTGSTVHCWRSTDDGATWGYLSAHAVGAAVTGFSQVPVSSAAGRMTFALTISGASRVVRTTDTGATWATVTLAGTVSVHLIPRPVVDPGTGAHAAGIIFAHKIGNNTIQNGLMVTADDGATWNLVMPQYVYSGASFGATLWGLDGKILCIYATVQYFVFQKCDPALPIYVALPQLAAFQPTSPAKLSVLSACTASLVTASKQGTVSLELQHYNDEIAAWCSLADVAGAWTDCGVLTDATPLSLPTLPARAGEKTRFRLKFVATDPTMVQGPPEVNSLSFAWTSDTTAPDAPTITRLSDSSSGVTYSFSFTLGALPAGARHLVVEIDRNGAGYLPLSRRGKLESGNGYLRFRGDISAAELAGEINSLSFTMATANADTIRIKAASEDDVGNQSAFTASSLLTITPAIPSLAVSPASATVEDGDSITLQWDSEGAASVSCVPDIGALGLSGSKSVIPDEDTDYVFTATSSAGGTSTATASITLTPPTPIPYIPVLVQRLTARINKRLRATIRS